MTAGVLAGVALALGVLAAWRLLPTGAEAPTATAAPPAATPSLDCFRLPWGGARELLLVPAGPDGVGEPALSARLFPDEDPGRSLASLLVANVSGEERWDVDLADRPLMARVGDGPWVRLDADVATNGLSGSEAARLRALGHGSTRFTLEPGSLRRVLVALPPRRGLAELTDVKWGDESLLRDRLDLRTVRRFRLDPGAVAAGR